MRAVQLFLIVGTTVLPSTISPGAVWAGVIINEVFYNAPNDLDDLQWIELYNDADASVDLGGWTLDDGKIFTFPKSTTIGAREYVVVALDPERFREFYDSEAMGPLERPLDRGGERIEISDATGRRLDVARYKDDEPWPVSPDGYTASLERICPSASGDVPENWAASPLSSVDTKPNGTPGKQNTAHWSTLPAAIEIQSSTPDDLAPEESLAVEAEVRGADLREVKVLYRVVTAGVEGEEKALPMKRDSATGRYHATIPGQKNGALVRYRLQAIAENGASRFLPAENDLRPTFSLYVHDAWESSRVPIGLILRNDADRKRAEREREENSQRRDDRRRDDRFRGRGPRPNFAAFRRGGPTSVPRPPRGTSTFVYVSAETGECTVLDYIHTVTRVGDRGFRVFFHKDRPLDGMRSLNVIFEGSEWSLLAESLAYDLYRRAGVPAPRTQFVRLSVDDRRVGYHLAVERINKSFLRRNEIYEDGDLFKIRWMGRDIVGRHQKRTNKQTGHDGLLAIIDKLEKSSGEEQWRVIRENFNVDQVASYFAVNTVLSHWDGFFNNHFPYHDTKRGKWELYPWDQDKTWGYYDGLPDDQVFFDMPITFGMEGDRPPSRGDNNSGRGFRRGPRWWRPGGEFSRPLLANPRLRRIFLDRTGEILKTVYTEDVYFPLMDSMAEGIEEEVKLRAEATGRNVEDAMKELERNVGLLKMHLTKRRQFLLEQLEPTKGSNAGKDDGE